MNSLKDIVSENIRKNWLEYKDILHDSPYYEIIWESLANKFKIDIDNEYFILFKKIISNEFIDYTKPLNDGVSIEKINDETIVLKGLSKRERSEIHLLCDKIGLHHESKTKDKKKGIRYLYINKPKVWLWEFSETNPSSRNFEINKQRKNEQLSRMYCDSCGKTALETEIFCSAYIDRLYCEECLEITSDGGGGFMGDHKFEPIY